MPRTRSKPRSYLELVQSNDAPPLAGALADPGRRKEVEHLTQQLVDVLVEMMDLVDDDPDREPDVDREDDDGL